MWPKTFHRAILLIAKDVRKAKVFLSDKRLTQQEKKVLSGYLLFRDNLNEEVLELMASISDPGLHVNIQMNLLRGMACNSLTQYHEAIKHFSLAKQDIAKDDSCSYVKMSVLLNLFTVHKNLNSFAQMKDLMHEMNLIEPTTFDMDVKKRYAQFILHEASGNISAAKNVLLKLDLDYPQMSEGLGIFHLLNSFMFYIKLDDFSRCYQILEKMKQHRKYSLTENFNFIKLMLNNLTDNKPMYFSAEDFKNTPVLLNMLQVIQSLILENKSLAEQYWAHLNHENPALFQANLTYSGEKCLFSLCLKKQLESFQKISQLDIWHKDCPSQSIQEKLSWIFENSNEPISKDQLFQFLFGKAPETKEDMAKLAKAIFNFRKQSQSDIVSKKGTYQRAS